MELKEFEEAFDPLINLAGGRGTARSIGIQVEAHVFNEIGRMFQRQSNPFLEKFKSLDTTSINKSRAMRVNYRGVIIDIYTT